jgi:hypothetical protein
MTTATLTIPTTDTRPATLLERIVHAFKARRTELANTVDAAILARRTLTALDAELLSGPRMAIRQGRRVIRWRTQPRGLDGKLLSRRWLEQAETFTPADLAWFRSPVASTEGR